MADDIRDSILPAIRKLAGANDGPGTSDAELLARWLSGRDEAAFELLVWRHAALVWGVCRQVLRHAQQAEDAFQATFLVLIRKGGSIGNRESLAAWLHRVAVRVALEARRENRPLDASLIADAESPRSASLDPDLRLILHEEIGRLPAKYRIPIVCCYLEGKTHEEAAVELSWPKGTVAGRLARARDLLRRRLARRGIEAESALAGIAASGAGWAGPTEVLLTTIRNLATNRQAVDALTGPSAELARGVIQEMFWTKTRWVALTVLCVSLMGLVTALAAPRPETPTKVVQKDDAPKKVEAPKPPDRLEEEINRARVRRQLQRIAAAMSAFRSSADGYPPPGILSREGKPLLSWRVALLLYLREEKLFERFKLDESWDSPHNKKLLAQMPSVFAPVNKTPQVGQTYFAYIVGPTAAFSDRRMYSDPRTWARRPGDEGRRFGPVLKVAETLPRVPGRSKIPDGATNTLLVVEAGSPIEWTRPDDVDYDPKKPLPKLGGQFASAIHALTADMGVITLPRSLDEKTMRAAITPAGEEALELRKAARDPGEEVRQDTLERLQKRNAELRDEATALKEVLTELQVQVRALGWAVEKDRLMKEDKAAADLVKSNEALEKELKEARGAARKMLEEVERLKKQLDKKGKE